MAMSLRIVAVLALPLLVAPAFAEDKMTSPPWGDDFARITFGAEDQGALQLDYKGQFRMSMRDTGSGLDGTDTTTNFGSAATACR
jgi:hypothetical protein